MVDERFELAAVIFRLAGRPEYGETVTDYHKNIVETFTKYTNHETIEFARKIKIGYDNVFKFSVHIEKKGNEFVFIEDIKSLMGNGWDYENVEKFIFLFNKFYFETNYAYFFNSHIELFEKDTKIFIDEIYSKIDFEWFKKYVDISNLRCIYSLSSGNYGATVNDKIVYCLVWGHGSAIVHEYCHHLASKIVNKWYNENQEFKILCDESVNIEKMPYYNNGWIMANEYITRAYDILYKVQHGEKLEQCLFRERNFNYKDSFKYIEKIYDMIIKLEK